MVGVGTSTWELDTKKAKNEKNKQPQNETGKTVKRFDLIW